MGDAALLTPPRPSLSGTEVRVLLFNSTGDRDAAALLKLLQVRGRLAGGRQLAQACLLCASLIHPLAVPSARSQRFFNSRMRLIPPPLNCTEDEM